MPFRLDEDRVRCMGMCDVRVKYDRLLLRSVLNYLPMISETISSTDRLGVAMRITWFSIIVNCGLMLFKLLAGIVGHSSAMLADAVHTISDFGTDFAVLIGMAVSRRPQDEGHPYGHGKYETLAAILVGVALCSVGVGLGWGTCKAIYAAFVHDVFPSKPGVIALVAGVGSIVVKEWLYRITVREAWRTSNDALLANAWHHRSDALSSIGVTVGIACASLFGGKYWVLLDPVAAGVVAVVLLYVSGEIILQAVNKLMECAMTTEENQRIMELALANPAVYEPHNLRTRRVGYVAVIDIHLRVDPTMNVADAHHIASDFEAKLRETFGPNTISTVHVEPRKDTNHA